MLDRVLNLNMGLSSSDVVQNDQRSARHLLKGLNNIKTPRAPVCAPVGRTEYRQKCMGSAVPNEAQPVGWSWSCLLYTSDAADE
eukprot:1919940-Heterocapsa_arctica.AAC.1